MSYTDVATTALAQDNGWQIISAFPDTWKVGKTTCIPAHKANNGQGNEGGYDDNNGDFGESAAVGEGDASVGDDPVRERILKCTADLFQLKRVTAGFSDWCTEPDEEGNVGCAVIADVSDGEYDAFDNNLRRRHRHRHRRDHNESVVSINEAARYRLERSY